MKHLAGPKTSSSKIKSYHLNRGKLRLNNSFKNNVSRNFKGCSFDASRDVEQVSSCDTYICNDNVNELIFVNLKISSIKNNRSFHHVLPHFPFNTSETKRDC